MKLKLVIYVLLVLTILIYSAGCSSVKDGIEETYILSGQILDVNKEGIGEVILYFSDGNDNLNSVTSNEDGEWSKTVIKGTITIIPVKEGWNFYPKNLKITDSRNDLVFNARKKTYQQIGTNVGEFVLEDGVSKLVIPDQALNEESKLTVSEAVIELPDFSGKVYEFGPRGLEFSVPVSIILNYSDLNLPPEVTVGNLVIGKVVNDIWEPLETTVNTDLELLTAEISSFSIIGIGFLDEGDDTQQFSFQKGDFAGYEVQVNLENTNLIRAICQFEVIDITSQNIFLQEITKLTSDLPEGVDGLPDLDLDNLIEEVGQIVQFSRWDRDTRIQESISIYENDYVDTEKDLASFYWIPVDINVREEVVLGDLALEAQGPLQLELPDKDFSFSAWKFEGEEDNTLLTCYYDIEHGLLLKLKLEDKDPARENLDIEITIKHSNLLFSDQGREGFIEVSSLETIENQKSGKITEEAKKSFNIQSGGSHSVMMLPPYSEIMVPMDSVTSLFGRFGEFFNHRISPQEDGYVDLLSTGLVAMAGTARAEPWGIFRQKVLICGEEGETGNYQISFWGDYNVEAVISSTESINDADTRSASFLFDVLSERMKKVPRMARTLKNLIQPVNHGRAGVRIAAVIRDDQGNELVRQSDWVHRLPARKPQSSGMFSWNETASNPISIDLQVELEAQRNYYLDLEVQSWLWLHAYGVVVQMGEIDGYVKLSAIQATWPECNPIVIPDSDVCPRFRIEKIPDQFVDEPFAVTVFLEMPDGTPFFIEEDSTINLILEKGEGNLGGTTQAILPAYESRVIFEEVTYDKAEEDVILAAEPEECLLEKLESADSNPFDVEEPPAHIRIEILGDIKGGFDAWNCSGLEGLWQIKQWQEIPEFHAILSGEGEFTMPPKPESGDWNSLPVSYTLETERFPVPDGEVEMNTTYNIIFTIIEEIIEESSSWYLDSSGSQQTIITIYTSDGTFTSSGDDSWDSLDEKMLIHREHHPFYCNCE